MQLTAIAFSLPWTGTGAAEYNVDITIDNLKYTTPTRTKFGPGSASFCQPGHDICKLVDFNFPRRHEQGQILRLRCGGAVRLDADRVRRRQGRRRRSAANPVPIRRLTNAEYTATVTDLFPGYTLPELRFVPDAKVLGFLNLSSSQTGSLVRMEQYEAAAFAIAQTVTADPTTLTGCDAAAQDEASCVGPYLADFGKRAYRRPLTGGRAGRLAGVARARRGHRRLPDPAREGGAGGVDVAEVPVPAGDRRSRRRRARRAFR